MDSLSDLLAKRDFDEPAESAAIRRYVHDKYKAEVTVQVRENDLLVIVPGAALAASLRYDTPALQAAAGTDRRISFRIARR